jgi:elongation factor G
LNYVCCITKVKNILSKLICSLVNVFNIVSSLQISVIDTPARVDDFTVEVENALQAFDCGGVHVLCSVDGLQSQSITVDKKMIRNKLPRLIFINNLDQKGANLWHVIDQARSKLYGSSAVIQLPIGLEDNFKGLVDLVQLKAYYFHGEKVVVEEVPAHMEALVSEKRHQLIVTVAHQDTELASAFCRDTPISADELQVCG